MTDADWQRVLQRWFGCQHALDHPLVQGVVIAVALLLAAAGVAILRLHRTRRISPAGYGDAWLRRRSWVMITALTPFRTSSWPASIMAAWPCRVCLLLRACSSRRSAAGKRIINTVVVVGIGMVTFAVFDHYDRLFFAAAPLTTGLLAVVTIPFDRPTGYIHRVALGVFGFLLFGFSLEYVGQLANVADLGNGADYRPLLITIILAVALNDVFAYCVGKAFGGRKLLPQTSPGKTIAGSLGALILASPVVALLFHFVLKGTPADRLDVLATLGAGTSVLGQLGDLVLSSIKRDVGIKDLGTVIPGHGGILDRFDSLILVPPATYHFLSLLLGPLAGGEPTRILSGG